MKRALVWFGLALGLALVAYAVFARKTDEELIQERLARLGRSIGVATGENPITRAARLNRDFSDLFTQEASVSIPELSGPIRGRRELAALATRAAAGFHNLDVAFTGTIIDLGNAGADVRTTATLSGVRSDSDIDEGTRHVSLRFAHTDGDWLIDSVSVSSEGNR
ncbi:MAG TPA: nuclear transport factor 2 family protein [Polyangiaceae bacterium]|nr:nuclear transport factor 2 family protein [Polyangiaceae bacterium]